MFGWEYRKLYKKGPGAGKALRNYTRKQSNRAMREHGKQQVKEEVEQ